MGSQKPLSGPNPWPWSSPSLAPGLALLGRPGRMAWGMPGLVKVDPWTSTDTDLPLILSLPTREEQVAKGGMIPLNSDWIAGFTVVVSWSTGSPVPDQDPGKDLPQGRIVPGGGRQASMAWAAGWKIALTGCSTMGRIGASPGRRPMGPGGAASTPVGRHQRLPGPGVLRWKGRSGGSGRAMGTHPFPVADLKPSPCGGAGALRPTQGPAGAGPAPWRPGTPLP